MITSGKSFSNCKVIALDPILKPVLNVKDIDLHFLTYFADTSFYLLVIKNYLSSIFIPVNQRKNEIAQQLIV